MKHKLYKNSITLIALCFLGILNAQKFDKKYSESFKVNKDVEISINASNTDINVSTWNKNEVQIDAFIEIEGLSKEEAEKYFKNWNFEALGNKRKVKITSKNNNSIHTNNDFIYFNDNWVMPEINIPDLDSIAENVFIFPNDNYYQMFSGLDSINNNNIFIDFDKMDFDFDFDFEIESLNDLEKNMEKEGKYSFEYHNDEDHIVIKSKEEWEKFKKSKKYKELKKKLGNSKDRIKIALENSKHQIKNIDKKKLKESLEKAKIQIKNIDKEQIRIGLEKAKEVIRNMNFNFNSDDITINGKKVKIKKRLEIKVPKEATFNLNTNHCKVKLPNTVASGNIKYGTFDVNNLNGGKLTINYSPVKINNLNDCTLFINNVTDAKIASVTNTTLSNNSSGVKIVKINENVNLSDEFGELLINSFNPNFGEFVLNVSHTDATLNFGNVHTAFKYNVNRVKLENKRADLKGKTTNNKSSNNNVIVNGEFSSVVIK